MVRKIFLLLSAMFVFASLAGAQTPPPTPTPTPAPTTAAADKPAKPPQFRSTKDQVKEAQTMLKSKGKFSGEVTGVSSAEWKTAVKAYQGDNGLTKTGSLNRATLEKMGIALTDKQKLIPVSPGSFVAPGDVAGMKVKDNPSTSSDGPKKPAPFSANKDQITALQKVLKDGKMFTGEANGERSNALKDAVKAYQKANGLKETGGINAATLEKAGIALTDKQKEQVAAQAAYDAAKAPKN
ncbi:MAG TPA: peptidoglycan-binding domain-containing protein [Pyrinomonadaceae bacterium]|nr:peptidoglycan-binding domain-containing protein [Pyrinomonadaceae bacterium]